MHEGARNLIEVVMEMIDGTLMNMQEDQFHAPAAWVLENWWHSLNAALNLEDRSEIGNHADSKANSFKATDEAESKK